MSRTAIILATPIPSLLGVTLFKGIITGLIIVIAFVIV